MCGLAGLVCSGPIDRAPLEIAADRLRHRGPDDCTVWIKDGVGFAHTRLAIIDRLHGEQPMFTADERFGVVFNGEIYNHRELRADLTRRGIRLTTDCDTEVLPHLFALEGPAMVHRLRGMFAFAVVDRERHEVFLARDRFGKKPLYWAGLHDGIAFASTLDALLPLLPQRPELDAQSIAEYMVLQYVPGSRAPWQGVHKVEPATWGLWCEGSLTTTCYWTPPLPDPSITAEVAEHELRPRIRDAVVARLESEVPIGVFLSGGIDSSVIAAEMVAAGVQPSTYAVGFDHGPYDERRWAAMVADALGTDHHVLPIDADAPQLLREMTWAYDEPFGDSSSLATLAVAKAAKEHVTVVLTGDGGDELFGGYDRYRAMHFGVQAQRRLGRFARPVSSMTRAGARLAGIERIEALTEFVDDPWGACKARTVHFWPHEVAGLILPEIASSIDVHAGERRLDDLWMRAGGPQGWTPWLDSLSYLPDDLLTKMDRATMASGVEARSPLLDHELWAWAATIPRDAMLNTFTGKRIVRRAYRGALPDAILERSKKGFSVPLTAWLRSHLRPAVTEQLHSDAGPLWDLLRRDAVENLVDRFMGGDDALTYRVWNLVALATWYESRR